MEIAVCRPRPSRRGVSVRARTEVASDGRRDSGTALMDGAPESLALLAALLKLPLRSWSPMSRNSPLLRGQPPQNGQKSHLIS